MAKNIDLWCDHAISLLKNIIGEARFEDLAFQNVLIHTLIPINTEINNLNNKVNSKIAKSKEYGSVLMHSFDV